MATLNQIVDDLATVLDKPVAEKIAQAILSAQESLVLRRLEALEDAVRQLAEEIRRSQQLFREMREEFQEYRKQTDERFRELAEAQRRTEERVEQLAQFQQKAYEEFQEYRKQTDERFRELREEQQRMYAEFQEYRKQTDERFRELREEQQRMYAEFQEYRKQTDERFRELVEAQRRTEEHIARLEDQIARLVEVQRHMQEEIRDIRRQLGGLSQTVGYTLENEAMKHLPTLLQEAGIRVEGRLRRQYVRDSQGEYLEVNIFGSGYRDGEQVTLVGESKSQLSKNDVDRFLRRTVSALQGVYPNIVPLLVAHFTSEPDAEEYARAQGVLVYYSYEF
ncbi:MAG: hypothetical protein RMM08_08650 [Armatimonadota bacterium]|nr:hypothetical protein [Armatimonadota bacterium]